MVYRVYMDLSFDITTEAQVEKLRDAILPFANNAVNINEGQDNEEIGFIEVRECNHDDLTRTIPDNILIRWEVGKGRVI